MKINAILNTLDPEELKHFFLEKISADESKVGKIFKVVGICAIVLSVVESLLHAPIYIGSENINAIVFGAGIASFLYSIFTEDRDYKKRVEFKDPTLETRLDFFLKKAREQLDADGAFLCKYHNGEAFGTYPNARFTMIKANNGSGVNDDTESFYNQPMEIYAEAYDQMGKQDFAVVVADKASPKMRFLMDGDGISVMLFVPIRKPISDLNSGMLGVKFLKENMKITHAKVEWLINYAQKATGILKDVEVKKR